MDEFNFDVDGLIDFIREQAAEAGAELADKAADIADYTATQVQALSAAINEPGFNYALKAARDNVALRAGITAVDAGDALDQRIKGIITGALGWAAKVLSTVGG